MRITRWSTSCFPWVTQRQPKAAKGSTILKNTTYDPGHKRDIGLFTSFEGRTSPIPASQRLSRPFLKAFDALTSDEARRMLRSPSPRKWPWWFSCPFMVGNLLGKCGKGNWDIQSQAGTGASSSLLQLLVQSVAIPSLNPYPLLLGSSDIEKLFWALWDHGLKENNVLFMMQPIRTTIDSTPLFFSQRVCVVTRERLQLWLSILNQLQRKNVKLDDISRRMLEQCSQKLLDQIKTLSLFPPMDSCRTLNPKDIRNVRRGRTVDRARNMWSRAGSSYFQKERLYMVDLLWNFLDQIPRS